MGSGAAKGGGQVAPPLSFWAVFPARANPLRNFFRGYTPPNVCRFVVPLMKQAMKMHCLTCEYFFCVKHKLTSDQAYRYRPGYTEFVNGLCYVTETN